MDTQAVSPMSNAPAAEPVVNPGAAAAPTPRATPAVAPQVDVRQRMAAVAQQLRDYLRSSTTDTGRSVPLALPVIGGFGSFASPGSITN